MTAAERPAPGGHGTSANKRYRFVMMVSIVLNVAVAFFIIFTPDTFTSLLGQPDASPATWPRHWGFQLLAINGLYLPGFWNPVRHRWPNWCGIVIRITFALFWRGMPYTMRNQITWVTRTAGRFKGFAAAGLAYGLILTVVAFTLFKGL